MSKTHIHYNTTVAVPHSRYPMHIGIRPGPLGRWYYRTRGLPEPIRVAETRKVQNNRIVFSFITLVMLAATLGGVFFALPIMLWALNEAVCLTKALRVARRR